MNDLKNKAAELGANYVQIETDRAGNTMSGGFGYFEGQQTDVTLTGNAFVSKVLDRRQTGRTGADDTISIGAVAKRHGAQLGVASENGRGERHRE